MQRGAAAAALPARPRSEPVRVWRHLLASVMTIAAEMRCPQYGLNVDADQLSYSVRSVVRVERAWSARVALHRWDLKGEVRNYY